MQWSRTLEPEGALMTAAKLVAWLCGLALAVSAVTAHAQSPAAIVDDREISVGRWEVVSGPRQRDDCRPPKDSFGPSLGS